MKLNSIIIIILALAAILNCSNQDNPRTVVKQFVASVLADDSTAVESLVDWDSMIKARLEEMSPEDSTKALRYYREQFLSSLLGDGEKRQYYRNSQIVIGKGEIENGRADVELSFIDRQTGVQNYTKVVLRRMQDSWKIVHYY
ncbi:MAG: hypothetical protein GF315_11640 [candidate division Zixibacteria bacterium]|nr:hypothetical protein [candidate division Zixibacteria bacterium]